MDRATALQAIRDARQSRGVSYDDLAKAIGTKDATYLAAALHAEVLERRRGGHCDRAYRAKHARVL